MQVKSGGSTTALIGSPELFSNPDKASSTLAFYCVRIVNNSAASGTDLFRARLDLSMKIWRNGRPRTCRTIPLRIVWRSFGPSAYSEPDELLAKGSVKSHCKYFTVLGFPPQTEPSPRRFATAKIVRERARLKCAGAGTLRAARVRSPFVRLCSITVKIGAKHVRTEVLMREWSRRSARADKDMPERGLRQGI
jgi:hypothetical protein